MRVVIDVQVGPSSQPFPDEIDELLERTLLLRTVGRSKCGELDTARSGRHRAEQILQPAGRFEEREALHVEEHVALRRRWQQPESVFLRRRQQVVSMPAGDSKVGLQRSLVPQSSQCSVADLDRSGIDGCQLAAGGHAGVTQAFDVAAPDVCNEAEVILRLPALLAMLAVTAEAAVRDRIG